MEFLNNTIGKYKLTRLIGEGGMASVYEGVHTSLGTKAAIKVLNPMLAKNALFRQRFKNEAAFMASLDHKNITKVLDFEDSDDALAIIMELLEGNDLNELVKKKGTYSFEEFKPLFEQILDAFKYAHNKGILHRDIKPSNIFVDTNGKVKILDFGIAKMFGQGNEMTQTGAQMGTPTYMSPEQVKGDKSIDHRSDIYSLGVTLYFTLEGKSPYDTENESHFDIFNKIVYEDLPQLSRNTEYSFLVQRACAKNREYRFQQIEDFEIASRTLNSMSSVKEISENVNSEIVIDNNFERVLIKLSKTDKLLSKFRKVSKKTFFFSFLLILISIAFYRLFIYQIPNPRKLPNALLELGLKGNVKYVFEKNDSDPNKIAKYSKEYRAREFANFRKEFLFFDRNGNVYFRKILIDFKYTTFKTKPTTTKYLNFYNEENQLIKSSYFKGLNEKWIKYTYKNGYLIREMSNYSDENYAYKYDKKGNLIYMKNNDYHIEYKYDENNKCTSNFLYNKNDLLTKTTIIRDNNGLTKIVELNLNKNKKVQKTIKKYNSFKDIIYSKEIFSSNRSPEIEETIYEYDKMGNWTKKLYFSIKEDNKKFLKSITTRKIEYYN